MDTLLNIKAFLATVREGSFSGAARRLGVAPSVIVKRINRLEDQMRAQLFVRSTRRLTLTDTGDRSAMRFRTIVAEVEDALESGRAAARGVEGHLRIKCPTTLTIVYVGEVLCEFQLAHPNVSIEVALIDRSVNPVEEGFDIAIGALPASYSNVIDEPLCPYPRVVCAAPSYVAQHGEPAHPRDLIEHDCLTFLATGTTWAFQSPRGIIDVEVRSRFNVNDSQVLHAAARKGLGIATIARYIARDSIAAGELKPLLVDYPVPELWLKALVPHNRSQKPAVQSLLQWLKSSAHLPLG